MYQTQTYFAGASEVKVPILPFSIFFSPWRQWFPYIEWPGFVSNTGDGDVASGWHILLSEIGNEACELVRSLAGPISSPCFISHTKENCDCEVFIARLDKRCSLRPIFFASPKHLSTWKQRNSCYREGFLSVDHNRCGFGRVTVSGSRYIHGQTISLNAGIHYIREGVVSPWHFTFILNGSSMSLPTHLHFESDSGAFPENDLSSQTGSGHQWRKH